MPLSARKEACYVCHAGERQIIGGRCWNCRGHHWFVRGHRLSTFLEGATVLELPNLSEWDVLKHKRDGTTVLRSTATGRERTWNSRANELWIEPDARDEAVKLLHELAS